MAALPPVPLFRLDHASVVVPDLARAVADFDVRLGLRATISAADPDRHSRVYLHRSYLEVAAGDADGRWMLAHFFLRFEDPAALAAHLAARGLKARFSSYTGVDGQWDDVEVEFESEGADRAAAVPLPILVRRTHPPDIARDWPPALRTAHPGGAWCLDAVVVTVADVVVASDAYRRLTGVAPSPADAGLDRPGTEFRLASGRIVLVEGSDPGPTAIVLGVTSLAHTAAAVAPIGGAAVAWLDPAVSHDIPFGFTEVSNAGFGPGR